MKTLFVRRRAWGRILITICVATKNSGQWQRNLHFFNNQVWARLLESLHESCKALLIQLKTEVLQQQERRKNERRRLSLINYNLRVRVRPPIDISPGTKALGATGRSSNQSSPPHRPLRN